MHFNLPILDPLASCRNILIVGMGGGFDVFCGLPIYFELQARGHSVHLANLTCTASNHARIAERLSPNLVGIDARQAPPPPAAIKAWLTNPKAVPHSATAYVAEYYLSQWFAERRGEQCTIWCFDKSGVWPLLNSMRRLITHLSIDGIILIDGGVDSLICGDETAAGSFIEEAISLAALAALNEVPVRILGCTGLGAELDIAYAHILENIAALTALGAFFGVCSLVRSMPAYQAYEEAVLFVQSQPLQHASIINSSIVSAVRDQHGGYHLIPKTHSSTLLISPLMALYANTDRFGSAQLALTYAYWNCPNDRHAVSHCLEAAGDRSIPP